MVAVTLAPACRGDNGAAVLTTATPRPGPPAAIRIDPPTLTIDVGADSQVTAIVTDASGTKLTGTFVSWNTTDGSIVSVSQTGIIRGVGPGTTPVTAVSGTHIALTKVTVAPASP
jgi:alpha-amylase